MKNKPAATPNHDWMNDLNGAGFKWKSSPHGCTQGLLMWNKPFIIKCLNENQDEEEVLCLYFSLGLGVNCYFLFNDDHTKNR